jgi:predicted  nucleic acid-binding Zn-ribbon protein
MDYPTLSTDNFYKFVALSGLVLTLFSFTYPVNKFFELQLTVVDTRFELAKFSIELDDVKRELKKLEGHKKPTQNDVKAIRERVQKIQIMAMEVQRSNSKLKNQFAWLKVYGAASLMGIFVGFLQHLLDSGVGTSEYKNQMI